MNKTLDGINHIILPSIDSVNDKNDRLLLRKMFENDIEEKEHLFDDEALLLKNVILINDKKNRPSLQDMLQTDVEEKEQHVLLNIKGNSFENGLFNNSKISIGSIQSLYNGIMNGSPYIVIMKDWNHLLRVHMKNMNNINGDDAMKCDKTDCISASRII